MSPLKVLQLFLRGFFAGNFAGMSMLINCAGALI
jgi:hypothetical protein